MEDDNNCYICFDHVNDKLIQCKNNHKTHYKCLMKWFESNKSQYCLICFEPVIINNYLINYIELENISYTLLKLGLFISTNILFIYSLLN